MPNPREPARDRSETHHQREGADDLAALLAVEVAVLPGPEGTPTRASDLLDRPDSSLDLGLAVGFGPRAGARTAALEAAEPGPPTAFALLTGELPYGKPKHAMDALKAHFEKAPRNLADCGVKVPAKLAVFGSRLLERDRDDWDADADEALEEIANPPAVWPKVTAGAAAVLLWIFWPEQLPDPFDVAAPGGGVHLGPDGSPLALALAPLRYRMGEGAWQEANWHGHPTLEAGAGGTPARRRYAFEIPLEDPADATVQLEERQIDRSLTRRTFTYALDGDGAGSVL